MDVVAPDYVMTQPCRDFYVAWSSWRGDSLMPHRRDVRLEEIKPLLPSIMVLDALSGSDVSFRLVGTKVVDRLGFDPAGMDYVNMARPEERHVRTYRLGQHLSQPCGSWFIVAHPYANEVFAPTECLVLPVRPGGDQPGLQLFAMSEHIGEGPLIWDAIGKAQEMPVAEEFRFVDIGAGVPAEKFPPDNLA